MKILSKILTRIILNSFFCGLFFGMTIYQAFVGKFYPMILGVILTIFYIHISLNLKQLILTAKEKTNEQDSSQTKS